MFYKHLKLYLISPTVRNCRIKTLPHMKKKNLLKGQTAGLPPLRSGSSGLAGVGSGLYRRGQAVREEESLWSLIICDHQMEQVDMPG
jgi:hypothetical protein